MALSFIVVQWSLNWMNGHKELNVALCCIRWSEYLWSESIHDCQTPISLYLSDLEETTNDEGADGVSVPDGFGDTGVEGKILAAKYARENKIPWLRICLGIQTVVVEYARSILGLQDASSTDFDRDSKSAYVIFIPEGSKTHMGGTMHLGSRTTYFQVDDCTSAKL
ncbi:hypothetical protein RND81_08G204000 [Saponaria officinalis]|uniref:CTP synthase (glutamine hydrolyzing) n=1 Tax=Saponaria officinalis TaxID=3572 RepID=A0AAW1JBG4_SAPOF